MPITTERGIEAEPKPGWHRLLWFAVLWAGGVAAVGAIGFLIRLVLKP